MAGDQVVALRLNMDASDVRKELEASGKAADQLAGDMQGMGGRIDAGGGSDEPAHDGVDDRLGELTGADRELVLRANIAAAEQGIRQIDQMLADPTLTDTELRIVLDKRNEASAQIDKLKGDLGELEQAVVEVEEQGERSFGALAGAIGSAGAASRIDEAVTSSARLRAQLGLTADEAREFDDIARQVYRDNFGESMGEAAQVTGQVHQALGLVDDELGNAVVGVFSIRDAFDHLGADADTTLNAVRTMRANFPNKSDAEILDLIAGGFQTGAGRAGDLIDVLQEYPGDFSRIGLSAEDMVGILNTGLDAGAWNADRVGDAVREMGIRITTAGDTGQDAIRGMFPADEAERLIRDFGRGGDAGRDAFFTIMDALTQVEDPAERFNLAVELMGTLGEELANQFPGMRDGLLQVRDGAQDAGTGVEGLAGQYAGFRNTLDGILRSLETSAVGTLGDVGLGLADVGANAGIAVLGMKGMMDVIPGLDSGVRGLAGNIGTLARNGGALAIAGIAVERTINAWSNEMGEAKSDAEEMADAFMRAFREPTGDMDEFHERLMAIGSEIQERLRAGDEALNPFLAERHREMAAALQAELDAMLQQEAAAAQLQAELGLSADEALRMATNQEIMGAAFDPATGKIDAQEASARDAVLAHEDLQAAIDGVNSSLRASFDPFFAATDAVLANEEAQRAVQEAHWDVTRSQDDLNAAIREHGEDSHEARTADWNLENALRNLDRANRDAGRSALEVASSMGELKMRVEEGTLKIEDGARMLDGWVRSGLITEDQARQLKAEMELAAGAAQVLGQQRPRVVVDFDASSFWKGYWEVSGGLAQLGGTKAGGFLQVREQGGWVDGDVGQAVPIIAHGREFVINAEAANRLGPEVLHALNRGELPPATYAAPTFVGGGSTSIDYDLLARAVARAGGAQVVVQKGDQIDENTVAAMLARKLG